MGRSGLLRRCGRLLVMTITSFASFVAFCDIENLAPSDFKKIQAEPVNAGFLEQVKIKQEGGSLVIDARQAFKAGMAKLVLYSPTFDATPYAGRHVTLKGTWSCAGKGAKVLFFFQGVEKSGAPWFKREEIAITDEATEKAFMTEIPQTMAKFHIRFDILPCIDTPIIFKGARFAPSAELPPVPPREPRAKPELLFHASFDESAKADFAKGSPEPLEANNLSFVPGLRGGAVRMTAETKSVLSYAMASNVVPERGTVSLWLKREWKDEGKSEDGKDILRIFFGNPSDEKGARLGSGQLWFWMLGRAIRADQRDSKDRYKVFGRVPNLKDWCHIAVTWDEYGINIFYNGVAYDEVRPVSSHTRTALRSLEPLQFTRQIFDKFFVGCQGRVQQIDGLIDDLRIYSAPLSDKQIKAIYRHDAFLEIRAVNTYARAGRENKVVVQAKSPSKKDHSHLSYCILNEKGEVIKVCDEKVLPTKATLKLTLPEGVYKLAATDGTNVYGGVQYCVWADEGNKYGAAVGEEKRELLFNVVCDKLHPWEKFKCAQGVMVKSLNGVSYLEASERGGGRMAFGFDLPEEQTLYCFEFDYPDDTVRTMDIFVQDRKNPWNDYMMQCGVCAGDEYPNTGKILTHRTYYWAKSKEVAAIAMTARRGKPAALSAIRVYRVKDNRLGEAGIKPVKGNRQFGLYYEDTSIGYNFATPETDGTSPKELDTMIARTIASMKAIGQNVLAYPGVWYGGLINEVYDPRRHAPDYLSAWYMRFDEEGFTFFPTMNVFTMPVKRGLVTLHSMLDGSLNSTELAILDSGKPNFGGVADTPPDFNVYHPKVQKHIERMIDRLIAQGVGHPSFGGISLHLTRHSFLWWGDETSGYNDYVVKAFAKEKRLKIPIDESDSLRGKKSAEWIRANAWDEWIKWRCDFLTKFYAKLAKKLSDARPDLKLWINSFSPPHVRHPDFMKPEYMAQLNRYAGLDVAALEKAASNLIICQTVVPADYRWRERGYPSDKEKDHLRVIETTEGFYALLKGATYPWIDQHDRYWESALGRTGTGENSLKCEWLTEQPWRVTTLNPSGVHALRHFVLPLRYGDVLGMSKGGFLIGTYGMEDVLLPFMREFRALPAVVFDDVKTSSEMGDVRVRAKKVNGKAYFYIVNTGYKPVEVEVKFPKDSCELVSGKNVRIDKNQKQTICLGGYEMKSFSAPDGCPKWKVKKDENN